MMTSMPPPNFQVPSFAPAPFYFIPIDLTSERWENLIDVVGSDTTSPAAIRIATRLLFAALIMSPQLNDEKQWADLRYALPIS